MMSDTAKPGKSVQIIVVTDLDGTLLDHETYDYSPALPALNLIRENGIPLILASSKTAAEISSLQEELGIAEPAIVENGGGISIPGNYFPSQQASDPVPGTPYETIVRILSECPSDLRVMFEGFCDWSVEEISRRTGLTPEAAARAKDRQWSVPGIWKGDERAFQEFNDYLEKQGLQITTGGRFIHIMGRTSKGQMLLWLMDAFRRKYSDATVVSIALGDAPNDRTMLEAADHAIVIPNLSGSILRLEQSEIKGVLHNAVQPGPSGWNGSVLSLLKKFKRNPYLNDY